MQSKKKILEVHDRRESASFWPWHRPCQICLQDDPESLYENRMAPINGHDLSYLVCRCNYCGFTYAADLATPATYEAYYRESSKYDIPKMEDFPSFLEQCRASAALDLCRPYLPLNASIADIGCGRGALLHTFYKAGFIRVQGLDPAPASATSLRIGPIHNGIICDASKLLPLTDVDLICLTGVLEHLPELNRDLSKLTSSLADHTRLLIEVPSQERFLRPQMEPFGEFSLEHIQYFTQHSLMHLMGTIGYIALDSKIVPLEKASDSIFILFSRAGSSIGSPVDNRSLNTPLSPYIEASSFRIKAALDSFALKSLPFAMYGAGSHSARLLPILEKIDALQSVRYVVDSNPNLQEKTIGSFCVLPPEALDLTPDLPVLVSSFHAQTTITKVLKSSNPNRCVMQLYPEANV
jgi:SAM-dependent methyltransferase